MRPSRTTSTRFYLRWELPTWLHYSGGAVVPRHSSRPRPLRPPWVFHRCQIASFLVAAPIFIADPARDFWSWLGHFSPEDKDPIFNLFVVYVSDSWVRWLISWGTISSATCWRLVLYPEINVASVTDSLPLGFFRMSVDLRSKRADGLSR